GLQNIQVVRFTGGAPTGSGTTAHTTLYVTTNNTSTGPISVDIDIAAGDIIGLLGTRGSNGGTVVNAYGTGPYTSTIDGNAVALRRLYYQSSTLPAGTLHDSSGTLSRVEVEYEPQQPFTAGTQTSVYSPNYRGYWFTAPAAMTIDGLQVPTTAGTGDQNIQVMRFNTAAPPTYSASTTDFTSLFTALNNTTQGFIPTSIAVAAGDIIGILGARGVNGSGVSNSYGPSSPYSTTLDGLSVTLERMVYQSNNLPAGDVSNNSGNSIGRIEFLYTPSSANTPPVASAGSGLAGIEGSSVSFAGVYVDPDPNDTHTFLWDFGDGTTSTAQRPTHIYVDDGSYTATFTVTDAAGASDSDTTTAVISNVAPTISSATNSGALLEGGVISFSASFSDPGAADTHTYLWNFGDGVTSVGAAPAHTYADNGAFAASVSVTDDDGGFDTFNFSVAIANVDPVANAGPNQSGTNSTPVSFSGSVTDQGSADTHTYLWAFGNGTFSTLQAPSFSYAAAGVYTATFTATDDDGGSDSDTATITITDNAPVANAGSNRTGNEGSAISFAGTFTDQGSGHTFLWNFGDGATATTQVATHTYADNATYQTTFTVTDAAGNFDTDNATATISNVAPTANAGANQSGNEGASLAFSGTFTDPGAADTHSYLWNFGDGT
ncbi:MAG: PKD domain-containing protein, partial [Candidatus Poribacteria bacterium]